MVVATCPCGERFVLASASYPRMVCCHHCGARAELSGPTEVSLGRGWRVGEEAEPAPSASEMAARLERVERECRARRHETEDLKRSVRRLCWLVAILLLAFLGDLIASQYWVLPWRRTALHDRVVAERFEVRNRMAPDAESDEGLSDRPDAVFGWGNGEEFKFGGWGGRRWEEKERARLEPGQGPGLYVRTPWRTDGVKVDEAKLKKGVLQGVIGLPR
ncbi:MAG: hypothetical protein U0793_16385 [Gemmataceae bacterium]